MRVALDTNRYSDLCRGVTEVVEVIEKAIEVFVPFVVLGELRAGFAVGHHGPHNERVLRRFLLQDGVRPLWPDDHTTYHYGGLFRQLREAGTPIPTNDLWIAALALQHHLVLHARDRHFDAVPQLPRI